LIRRGLDFVAKERHAMSKTQKTTIHDGSRGLLRVEGFALFAAAMLAFWHVSADWRLFAWLILIPDASFAAYLFGPRAGAFGYNAMHSTMGPFLLAAYGVTQHIDIVLAVALVWFAHVGFDRALGYGLKSPSGFRDTHLGRIGPKLRES
jgi:hypothetical protein